MSRNDITIVSKAGLTAVPTFTAITEAGATDILAGEPLKVGGTGSNFAIPLATGDPETSTDRVLGIAAGPSDHTASANGTVEVYKPLAGVVYRCNATTPGNLADGVLLDRVALDLTGAVYTVDENEGDNADHGLVIVGYDATEGTVDFEIMDATKYNANSTV